MSGDQAFAGIGQRSSGSSETNRLDFVIRQAMNGMTTAIPVIVRAVAAGRVDVQPMVSQLDGAGNAVPHGTIHGLPVWRYQAGNAAVILDPVVGDKGLAIFCHSDISSVKKTGKVANPGSRRKFDWSDGIYLGGILNDEPTQFVRVSGGGIELTAPLVAVSGNLTVGNGASGVFTTGDGRTVTVVSGIITEIA